MVVALVRAGMVHGNKFLWEIIINKKQWAIAQEANSLKQKETTEGKPRAICSIDEKKIPDLRHQFHSGARNQTPAEDRQHR